MAKLGIIIFFVLVTIGLILSACRPDTSTPPSPIPTTPVFTHTPKSTAIPLPTSSTTLEPLQIQPQTPTISPVWKCTGSYTITLGDTLIGIARENNVPVQAILDCNEGGFDG